METKRKALGKGLEQLFSNEVIDFGSFEKDIKDNASKGDIVEINIKDIRSNPYQPRKSFNEKTLNELADSIKEHGIIEPIIVKKSLKGYELIAGERRTKAAELAGLDTIPAIITEYDDNEMMQIALLENIQREDLNAIEEAEAYQKIIDLTGMTQEEFAKKFGKSRSHVTNMLGLLNLPTKIKELVIDGSISMGHARSLSKLADEDTAYKLAMKVVKEHLSVHALEELLKDDDHEKREIQKRTISPSKVRYNIYERVMREKIGSKVKIKDTKIEIPFDSEKDLERILEILDIKVEGID